MLYPPVADLLKNVQSRYLLVNLVAQRARQIATEAEEFQEELTEKLKKLAGDDSKVIFVGKISDEELKAYFNGEEEPGDTTTNKEEGTTIKGFLFGN